MHLNHLNEGFPVFFQLRYQTTPDDVIAAAAGRQDLLKFGHFIRQIPQPILIDALNEMAFEKKAEHVLRYWREVYSNGMWDRRVIIGNKTLADYPLVHPQVDVVTAAQFVKWFRHAKHFEADYRLLQEEAMRRHMIHWHDLMVITDRVLSWEMVVALSKEVAAKAETPFVSEMKASIQTALFEVFVVESFVR